jgi:hypothetical protein
MVSATRAEARQMKWRFIRQVILCAFLYGVVCVALNGLIFLLSHIPPGALNFDKVILKLGGLARFLAWPRILLRHLWPGEATSSIFNFILSGVNCLLWGLAIAGVKNLWVTLRK